MVSHAFLVSYHAGAHTHTSLLVNFPRQPAESTRLAACSYKMDIYGLPCNVTANQYTDMSFHTNASSNEASNNLCHCIEAGSSSPYHVSSSVHLVKTNCVNQFPPQIGQASSLQALPHNK